MSKISIIVIATSVVLAGCSQANVMASKWDSGLIGANAQTRCEHIDMRNQTEMNNVFGKYDGWKLVYISEYTTDHKMGTDSAVCFERAKN